MNPLVELWETPTAADIVMIAGWSQWADAGNISSGLPHYLIETFSARRIGQIASDSFYLFQVPGTHHFLRPEVSLTQGQISSMSRHKNEFYYLGSLNSERKGLVIFLGEEPRMQVDRYVDALLDAAQALRVRRIIALGGVYGAMPYDKDREVSCVFSQPHLADELASYAVRFTDYEGGVTISTYLVDAARRRVQECLAFYSFIPAYDFSAGAMQPQSLRIDDDYRAWHELMRRINHMADLRLDLEDLEQRGEAVTQAIAASIADLDRRMPQLNIRAYLATLSEQFTEHPFLPLDDVWTETLNDILEGFDEE